MELDEMQLNKKGVDEMGKTLNIQPKPETKVEVFNRIANNTGPMISRTKVFKMRDKMINAFKELKESQQQLKKHQDSLDYAQQELEIWKDNYVKLFNAADVGYFTVYKDLVVKEVNKAAVEMLGYDKFEIIGQPIIVHAKSKMRDDMRNYYSKVFEQGQARTELCLTTNSKEVDVVIQSVVITDQNDPMSCCVSAVIDVSEIGNSMKQLADQQKKLENLAEKHARELDTVLQRHQQQIEDYSVEQQEFDQQKLQLQTRLDTQIQDMERLKDLNDQVQAELDKVCKVKDEFWTKCQEYENLVKEQTSELAQLKGKLEKAAAEKEQFEQTKKEYDTYRDEAQQRETGLQDEISSLKNDVEDLEIGRNQLNGKITVLEQQIKDSEAKNNLEKQKLAGMVHLRSKKIAQLVERLEKLKSQSSSIISDLKKRLDDTERVLGGKINELGLINTKLQKEVSTARNDAQVYRSKANELEKNQNALESKAGELDSENEKLANQLSSAKDDAQLYRSKSDRLEKLLLQSRSEFAAAEKEIKLRGEKIESLKANFATERDGLVAKLSSKSDELDMLNEVYIQQKIDIETLNSKLTKVYESNNRLEIVVEQNKMMLERLCDVGAITMNIYNVAQRKMAYVNKHIGEVLGYSAEQIEQFGEDVVTKIMHPDDMERINKDLAGFSWDDNQEVLDIEYRLQDASGNWRYIHSQEVVLSLDKSGKPLEVLGVQYDYTEKIQAKEGMKALAKIVAMVGKD